MLTVCGFVLRKSSVLSVHGSSLSSVQGACCLDTLVAAYAVWSGFSPCAYADASPGVMWLVGRELAQSLGALFLVSVLHKGGSHS